jgi:hypothetical protein
MKKPPNRVSSDRRNSARRGRLRKGYFCLMRWLLTCLSSIVYGSTDVPAHLHSGEVSDLDQAMKLANSVKYGLTAGFTAMMMESGGSSREHPAGVNYASRPQVLRRVPLDSSRSVGGRAPARVARTRVVITTCRFTCTSRSAPWSSRTWLHALLRKGVHAGLYDPFLTPLQIRDLSGFQEMNLTGL